TQVGVRGAPSCSPTLSHQDLAEPLRLGSIRSFDAVARLSPRGQPCRRRATRAALPRDVQRATRTLVWFASTLELLDPREVLDDPGKRPLMTGLLGPLVVVGGEPTYPHHGVQRRRPTERFAPWPIDAAAIELGLRLGQIVPVKFAAEQLKPGDRHMDATVIVLRASLQHEDLITLVGAESRGDNRAGRAGTNHHIIRNSDGAVCRFIHFSISPCRDVFPTGKVLSGRENGLWIRHVLDKSWRTKLHLRPRGITPGGPPERRPIRLQGDCWSAVRVRIATRSCFAIRAGLSRLKTVCCLRAVHPRLAMRSR